MKNTRTNFIVACAGLSLSIAAFAPSARANLIVDPSFESNPLVSDFLVLGNFPAYQGVWGQELSTITGPDDGVIPAAGSLQLRMAYTGSYTQAFQPIDVTASAGLIDSGGAAVNMNALYNANLPAALGAISVSFFTTSTYGSITGTAANSFTLDGSANSWEPLAVNAPIPVGTRWLLAQVAYQDASLIGSDGTTHPGFVDAADLTIRAVPEPAAILSGLIFGGLALTRRRRLPTA